MASIHIFQNKSTGDIVLCPFAFCKELGGGSVAAGALIRISLDDFLKRAAEIVSEEFEAFYTRDASIESELYERMSKPQRKKFFSEHRKVIVSWPIKTEQVNVYTGPDNELYGRLDFPFNKVSFANYLLGALSKAE